MPDPDFDVLVIGAGPTGASAAYRLAAAGYRIGVVDKADFPRPKPCGGGLTIKTLDLMPFSIAPVLRSAANSARIGLRTATRSRTEIIAARSPVCAFVVREAFDAFHFGKMIEQGAEFLVDGSLKHVEERADQVAAVFETRTLTARYLIGADGANSAVRRLTGAGAFFSRGFAIEGILRREHLAAMPPMEFFFGYVAEGYGWLFPKGDHVNVGIYTSDSAVPLGKEMLRAYCRDRLGSDALEQIVGFPLGFGGQLYAPDQKRIVLAGDAAGMVEPILGEGLHNAVKTGQAAADAVMAIDAGRGESLGAVYAEAIVPVIADLRRCERIRRFLYGHMEGAGFRTLGSPIAKYALARGFAAGKTVREITSRPYLAPFFRPSVPQSLREYLAASAA